MRICGINPKLMCRQHLLGEHKEIHMIIGCIRKGKKLNGYIKHNQIDVSLIMARHYKLVEEMKRRGYNHQSPITLSDAHLIAVYLRHNPSGKIDPVKNQIMCSQGEAAGTGTWNTYFWIDPKDNLIYMVWTQIVPWGVYDFGNQFRVLVHSSIIN